MYWTGSKEIKIFLTHVIHAKAALFKNKKVLDVPAGSGETSQLLRSLGANVTPIDLFPEFFKVSDLNCLAGDLNAELPVQTADSDWIICQEGVEHLPNQLYFFNEMNRCLKLQGHLLLTTPNCSNLRSRWAHFLSESETLKVLPHNELDTIWLSSTGDSRIYFGHLFSSGIHKLNLLARCAGFELKEIHPARINWSSFILLVIFFPFILIVHSKNLLRAVRKRKLKNVPTIYKDTVKLAFNINILCGGHLILEYVKVSEQKDVVKSLQGVLSSFDVRT